MLILQLTSGYNKYENDAKRYWDIFYKNNKDHFFKDRHYIDRELTELVTLAEQKEKEDCALLEIGCGVGNTIFPLAEKYPKFKFYGFDISPRAVQIIKDSSKYDPDRIFVDVVDIVKDPFPVSFGKPDIATLVFVLSAVSPRKSRLRRQKNRRLSSERLSLVLQRLWEIRHGAVKARREQGSKAEGQFLC